MVNPDSFGKNVIPVIALLVSFGALFLTLRRDLFMGPEVTYTLNELQGYPVSNPGLSLAVKRAELPESITLRFAIETHLRNTGNRPAVNVQARVRAEQGSYIVQVHTDDSKILERFPDLGRQGSPEVLVTIPLMVPGEEVKLTFWYGLPGKPEIRPESPTVLIRHSEGLGRKI